MRLIKKSTPKRFCFDLFLIAIMMFVGFLVQTFYSIPNSLMIIDGEKYEFEISSVFKVDINSPESINRVYLSDNKLTYEKNEVITAVSTSSDKNTQTEAVVKLFNIFPLKTIDINFIPNLNLVPCGNTIGIKVYTNGVLVVGNNKIDGIDGQKHEPYKEADIRNGDYIVEIDNSKVSSVDDIINIIEDCDGNELKIKLIRDSKEIETRMTPIKSVVDDNYKIGLWVKDGSSGIGTMTFYNKETQDFGALGHGIADIDTGKVLNIDKGIVLDSEVIAINKGQKGVPGELVGDFSESSINGEVNKNLNCGIFGTLKNDNIIPKHEDLKIGLKSEIRVGEATILSSVDSSGEPKEYKVSIEKIYNVPSNESKSLLIKIIDEELLDITGGIIQGMSGSPIIQNGKLIGAVTHVLVNDPTKGYGVTIEDMILQQM